MSLGDLLPVHFYQLAFFVTMTFMPLMALKAEVEVYVFGAIVMYMCIRVIKRRLAKTLPAEGKAVFITGCDTGFGHMSAIRLHSKGYKVFAGCLEPEGAGAAELKEKCPDNLHVLPIDVTKDDSVNDAREYVEKNLGDSCLWAVVSNAGIFGVGDVELCTMATFQQLTDVNFFGMIRVTKKFLPLLRKAKGRVVVVSSSSGRHPWPSNAAYNSSKAALDCVTGCLRMEMKRFGVKVTSVQPAMFGGTTNLNGDKNVARYKTEMERSWSEVSDEVKAAYHRKYLDAQVDVVVSHRESLDAKSPDPVLDAVEAGVSLEKPEANYVVHGGPFYVDPAAMFGSLYAFLPTFLTDWFACQAMGIHPPKEEVTSSNQAEHSSQKKED